MDTQAHKDIHTFQGSIDLYGTDDNTPTCTIANHPMSWEEFGKFIHNFPDFNFHLKINGSNNTICINQNKPKVQPPANDVISIVK